MPPQNNPVPYLFGGLAALLGLIAISLLLLVCSYWKINWLGGGEQNGGEDRDLEAGGEGDDTTAQSAVGAEMIPVIMAGAFEPTYLATPMSFGVEIEQQQQ
ncbi:hypothetical protein EZV62_025459 [Acer yangbiense]|uniref:Uncharacterized protein n=1 Tax=Acer yangbiense TaxID=1000413 RepID=A0A5C7GXV2_9ROSI|nr:hypothetical protein EZV62_025459 [Acer yangbiense]